MTAVTDFTTVQTNLATVIGNAQTAMANLGGKGPAAMAAQDLLMELQRLQTLVASCIATAVGT